MAQDFKTLLFLKIQQIAVKNIEIQGITVESTESTSVHSEAYKVYLDTGHCFIIEREEEYDSDDYFCGYSYSFTQPYDGFKNDLSAEFALQLIK